MISTVCNIYRGDKLHTAESKIEMFHLSLVAFKGTIRRNPLSGEHTYHEKKIEVENVGLFHGVLPTRETTLSSNILVKSKPNSKIL